MSSDRLTISEINEREIQRKQTDIFFEMIGGANTEKTNLLLNNLSLIYIPARKNMNNMDLSQDAQNDAFNVVSEISSSIACLAEHETTVDEVAKKFEIDLSDAETPTIRGQSNIRETT